MALVLVEFRLSGTVMQIAPWAALGGIVAYLRLGTPSSKLSPDRRAQRDERRSGAIVGTLSGLTVLGAIVAAHYLTTWSQWLVLGSLFGVVIGVGLMLHVRFTIGS